MVIADSEPTHSPHLEIASANFANAAPVTAWNSYALLKNAMRRVRDSARLCVTSLLAAAYKPA